MALQKEEEDNRTVEEYLRDIAAIEEKGLYPQYSKMRKRILEFWMWALTEGLVKPNERVQDALKKLSKKT
ncbi:MAG: hypothetical protein QXW32_03375 [Nitrososphaerales archaeon]